MPPESHFYRRARELWVYSTSIFAGNIGNAVVLRSRVLNLLDDGVPHDPEDPYAMNRHAEIVFAVTSCHDPAI